jgi:valyl-tRNA synthetase
MEIPTKYNPKEVEDRWYNYWLENNYFRADSKSEKEPFCIVIPPPNVTGSLHLGHALNDTLQDILIRWKRMQGYNALWLPGTDHAGIATQNVVEKELAKEGLTRQNVGREKFIERVWRWKETYGTAIINQLKKLGCSCDWSRIRFTMDEGFSRAVQEEFITLYNQGFIYRGSYIVNWCPRCQTAISDLEVEHKEINGHLYYVKYFLAALDSRSSRNCITVATTRPETIFGDIAIAVNPKDRRYKSLVGKLVKVPGTCGGREIPVIADDNVDIKFGTGCLKITPAHDPADFEIGKRHNLEVINVIGPDGKMNNSAGRYNGLDRFECRKVLVKDLENEKYIEKIEDYKCTIGSCSRCDTYVEPYLSMQWFVSMKKLAEPAIKAVRDGKIKFVPGNWEKIYFQWMENIRDWCISRQLWWGHRIPVWYCDDEKCPPIVTMERPEKCPKCGSGRLTQDEDVLDTWFSSDLWPFATLGWPENTEDLKTFYPTAVLSTAFDIIFFWVARMVMISLHFMKDVPFGTVYIHALVRDPEGKKMSKSKGNVIDPLAILDTYGTDSLRFTLAALAVKGRDIYISDERIQGYRNFMNKIWNASRFIMMNFQSDNRQPAPMESDTSYGLMRSHQTAGSQFTLADRWIISRINQVTKEMTNHLKDFDFDKAALLIYEFFWHEFCDWYIEIAKMQMQAPGSRLQTSDCLYRVLEQSLRLMHPFIPFITEEIWQTLRNADVMCHMPDASEKKIDGDKTSISNQTMHDSIMVSKWPEYDKKEMDTDSISQMELIKEVVFAIRNIRSELNIPPPAKVQVIINYKGAKTKGGTDIVASNDSYVKWLAGIEVLKIGTDLPVPRPAAGSVVKGMGINIPLEGIIDIEKEKARLQKEIEKTGSELSGIKTRLSKKEFVEKAPPEIVAKEKERRDEIESKLHKLSANLKMLEG